MFDRRYLQAIRMEALAIKYQVLNSQPTVIVMMAAAAYGGTDRSCAAVDL